VALAAVVPVSSGGLAADPDPTTGFDDAIARFQETTTNEDGLSVYEPCRSRVFDHGGRTDVAIVLYHGLTNCPQQFIELGRRLHADGANVVILRAPHHGLAVHDGATIGGVGLVGDLSARDLRNWADESIDIASGLGERVQVLGLSMGGAVSMWSGQFRDDVDRAVVVAPGVSIPFLPHWVTTAFVNTLNRVPNLSVPTGGDRLDHAYDGGSTGALASLLLLARATEHDIARHPSSATEVIVVLNPNDDQVDNDVVRDIVGGWRDGDGEVEILMIPDTDLPHDLIDPAAPGGDIELVYPFLIDLLGRPPD
jgi:carboxylesterase